MSPFQDFWRLVRGSLYCDSTLLTDSLSKVFEELGSYIANGTTGGKISNELSNVFEPFLCVSLSTVL